MAFVLRCPDCRGKFPWDVKATFPRFCPLCQADMGEVSTAPDSAVVLPAFISAKTRQADKLQHDIVQGSHKRAELAAQVAGCDVADMSSLKIHDLNTRRDAEIMAPKVDNEVSRLIDAGIGGFKGADGLGYSAAVQSGPFANSGAKMRTVLHNHHAQLSRGSAVSDIPALETTVPTYRRRG